MTKLKEPIYEFDVNIHYLPIYIKKKNVYCPSKIINQEKNNKQTIRLNQKNPSLNLMRIFMFCQYYLLSKAKLLI